MTEDKEIRPLVSVIIPVYNTEKYLCECIRSVVNQSYEKLEIILIDDGSSDGSLEICCRWAQKDSRIKILSQSNLGLSVARNVGVAASKGEYISFIDSDDWIDRVYYETMVSALVKYDADIVASGVVKAFKNAECVYPSSSQPLFNPEQALSTVISGTVFTVMACNKLFRRSLIVSCPFPEGCFHEDDYVMYGIIASSAKLAFCQDVLYHYRQRKHGIINSGLVKRFDDKYKSYFQNLSLVQKAYPRLVPKMKLLLCRYVINDYTDILNNPCDYDGMMKKEIVKYRKSVRFSLSEFVKVDIHHLKLIFLSSYCLKPYCQYRLRSLKTGGKRLEYYE